MYFFLIHISGYIKSGAAMESIAQDIVPIAFAPNPLNANIKNVSKPEYKNTGASS